MENQTRIFCALDTSDLEQAKNWAAQIGPVTGALKLGLEFAGSFGPQGIEAVQNAAPDAALFIDLKFHDIPNTVAGAVHTICTNFAPSYLNVHAAGGQAMMEAAKAACETASPQTKLLAVTILTSLSEEELYKIGYREGLPDRVIQMALLAETCGLDGVVCSSHEISLIRQSCADSFETMVPGIRPLGSAKGDQNRIMTPKEAVQIGATHLVIGRPITAAPDPAKAAQEIIDSLNAL
ncbi:MAG: orotidine-5'-phosphate decarboxylase [Rhodospirillales bacterium]|nr:orotidine-5'-phosphate decarboxylase [Rhodospirillales bacterium]